MNKLIGLPKIGRTKLKFNFELLQNETWRVLEKYPIDNITNQLSLTHRPHATNPFYDGVGSLYDYEKKEFKNIESDFSEFNKALEGTYFEEIYKTISSWAHFAIGRVRIMRLNPKSCLSMHQDKDIRFHLPILTNPQAYMVFADALPQQIPADGHLYWANTLGLHSVFNGHNTNARYHLVFSTCANNVQEYYDFIESQIRNDPLDKFITF